MVLDSALNKFGIDKSIGFGSEKTWYQKKNWIRLLQITGIVTRLPGGILGTPPPHVNKRGILDSQDSPFIDMWSNVHPRQIFTTVKFSPLSNFHPCQIFTPCPPPLGEQARRSRSGSCLRQPPGRSCPPQPDPVCCPHLQGC